MNWTNLPLEFNPNPPQKIWIDLNSAFASIEQLCDPFLRGKPIAVAAYTSPRGCIVAPSIEAKKLGIKTGMLVQDGLRLCRDLIVLPPDTTKYFAVNRRLHNLFSQYTDELRGVSIDEFSLDMEGFPIGQDGLVGTAQEIKQRIRSEVGESLTVSVGLGPNYFLAKLAAGLRKPDGLEVIDHTNFQEVYGRLRLMQLHGIKERNCIRLNGQKIFTVMDFYNAPSKTLHAAFGSVGADYWRTRLHGFEIDDVVFDRHSYGNSFAVPEAWAQPEELAPVLQKLIEKSSRRMRRGGYACRGVHVIVAYRDSTFWHKSVTVSLPLFDSRDIYKVAFRVLCSSPHRKPVRVIGESLFNLQQRQFTQTSFLEDETDKIKLVEALDAVNDRWGEFSIVPALMLGTEKYAPERVSFGSIKELEEMLRNSDGS